ncbi:MAG: helix-turn-helix transcriptional regulator [Corynebacterium humireducens]|jgi:transcriptional regulator with XRE-family HTH domain|uniref:Helix-turn-helix transcriptional regulator n=1 Tax=Corynebacterium humireducens TaxID=1223514 RepID=A0A7X6SUP5_9CORY|nr:helix-turn-helix transcriptional regulator [Corynebacterium humireducens]
MSNSPDEAQKRLGALIREAREAEEMTQQDLAEHMSRELRTSIHKTVVSKVEAGTRALSFREAAAICKYVPVSLEELGAAVDPGALVERWEHAVRGMREVDKALEVQVNAIWALQGQWSEILTEVSEPPVFPGHEVAPDVISDMLRALDETGTVLEYLRKVIGQYGYLEGLRSTSLESVTRLEERGTFTDWLNANAGIVPEVRLFGEAGR